MIIDTSAVIAVFLREPGHEGIDAALVNAEHRAMSTPTIVELGLVTERLQPEAGRRNVARFLRDFGIEETPFTSAHATLARECLRRYGRGSGSQARLNLGDSFSYALAIATDQPLLFVGDDFTHTDVIPALP